MIKCQDNPLVSVIIPCFNHERYVQETIKSVIDQDYDNIELIIIDDGSTDGSVEMIAEMVPDCERRFVRFDFRCRENRGLCETLNEAISWCSGYYLSPIASDDILLPNKISSQVVEFSRRCSERKNLVAIYSGVEFVDQSGIKLSVRKGSGRYCGFNEVICRTEFLPTPTFMVIKEKLMSVGGFNSKYNIEDFYIRLKLTEDGSIFYTMPDILVRYRRHGDNLSKKSEEIWKGVSKILEEYKDFDIYNKALSKSMMVQAHDYQVASNAKGIRMMLRAVRLFPLNLFTVSIIKFIIKIFMRVFGVSSKNY